jgi:signal transduction histidine kinase
MSDVPGGILLSWGIRISMENRSIDDKKWREIEEALVRCHSLAAAGKFAASVMHEINNPLEAISNLTYLIQKNADDPDKVRDYSRVATEHLAAVVQIARRTLSFYRAPGTFEVTDLSLLTAAALRVHEEKIRAKGIKVHHTPHNHPVKLHAGEILQVISNLIANSVDALPDNGALHVRIRKSAREIHLIVADNGHGIPTTISSKIWEPFYTTKNELGTGLGLAISKAIIERHNGKIRIRSSVRPGRTGTAFRISLPLDRVA